MLALQLARQLTINFCKQSRAVSQPPHASDLLLDYAMYVKKTDAIRRKCTIHYDLLSFPDLAKRVIITRAAMRTCMLLTSQRIKSLRLSAYVQVLRLPTSSSSYKILEVRSPTNFCLQSSQSPDHVLLGIHEQDACLCVNGKKNFKWVMNCCLTGAAQAPDVQDLLRTLLSGDTHVSKEYLD